MDYSVFPPLNATLNGISTILLLTGFLLIKSGKKEAHQKVMLGALSSSALFLVSYLWYHYGVGHTTFPEEYPTARIVYLSILIPHIILAVVNVPLILLLVIAAFRGKFERHKKLARYTFPSWLFVSFTGVIIYFMIYVWFTPTIQPEAELSVSTEVQPESSRVTIVEASTEAGDLLFEPAFQAYKAEAGQKIVKVTFEVSNRGDVPRKVKRLESSCACLSVVIDQNPIPANGTATITGIFEVEKLHGKSERKINVVLDGQFRPVFLTTRIDSDPLYLLEEQMTTWKVGGKAEPKTVKFRVKREEPIHVLSAESKREEVSAELVVVEKGRAYDIVLTPESTDSSLLGIVRITTDCEIESYARPLAYFSIQ